MCMRNGAVFCAAVLIAVSPAFAQAPQFGQPIAPADIAPWDISIGPDGAGLPAGRGSAKQGEAVYAAKCRACHGENGVGRPNDALVGDQVDVVVEDSSHFMQEAAGNLLLIFWEIPSAVHQLLSYSRSIPQIYL